MHATKSHTTNTPATIMQGSLHTHALCCATAQSRITRHSPPHLALCTRTGGQPSPANEHHMLLPDKLDATNPHTKRTGAPAGHITPVQKKTAHTFPQKQQAKVQVPQNDTAEQLNKQPAAPLITIGLAPGRAIAVPPT